MQTDTKTRHERTVAKMSKNDRMSVETVGTVETVETVEIIENVESNEGSSPRRSPRKKKLRYASFEGMQGKGGDEHYKLGVYGGAYRGSNKKRAPKSAH